jgi:hypothetical protein
MDDKNQPCIVLQYKPDTYDYILVGMEVTTTYNYWEKEAFVHMNKDSLFPCKDKGVEYNNFEAWSFSTQMIIITDEMNIALQTLKANLNSMFYPGY